MGFNDKPTEVTVNIVLETTTFSQAAAVFDITKSDLHCDAGVGGLSNEIWYDLNIEGFQLSNFLLYSYNFSIENGQKILNVTFKDYSLILDKIYVGLFKKQGILMPHSISCQLQLPVRCQDCEYTGSAVTGTGFAYRDINFGCYVGNNGNVSDLFVNTYYGVGNVFNVWNQGIIGPAQSGKVINQFDLNKWIDLPASDHNGAAPFAFADGHALLRRWVNASTKQPQRPGAVEFPLPVSPNETTDLDWVLQRTSVKPKN